MPAMNTCSSKVNALMFGCLAALIIVSAIGVYWWLLWSRPEKSASKQNWPSAVAIGRHIQELERKNSALAVRQAMREYDERSMRLKAIRDEWGIKK